MRRRRDEVVESAATAAPEVALAQRLDALEDALVLLGRHGFELPPEIDDAVVEHARARLRHGSAHAVIALVGSTGSGKSSLLNALVGEEVARAGVTRPTTAVTQAVTIGEDAGGLLDLIGVSRRHRIPTHTDTAPAVPAEAGIAPTDAVAAPAERAPSPQPQPLEGLVLLDLPDFDSVTVAHRLEVDRLITLVDLLVWVTDPQKYADEALHDGYLRRFSGHGDVMQVVLNKVDTVPGGQLAGLLADLSRLLADDGLPDLTPVPTSTLTPGGVDPLRAVLAEAIAARSAALDRIDADLRSRARRLRDLASGAEGGETPLPASLQSRTAEGLAAAAGVPRVAALVAAQHRRDARLATGWPPLRWLRRVRRAPLERLDTTTGNRVATAEVSRTLRATAATAADTAGPRWAQASSVAVRGRVEEVSAALDTVISRDVQVLRQPPTWWRWVAGGHRILLLVALVGALWLAGIAAAQALLLLDAEPFTPHVGVVPLPTVLLLAGLLGGVVLALISALIARAGARRQGRRAVASLTTAVEGVTAAQVIAPLQDVLADREEVDRLLAAAGPAA